MHQLGRIKRIQNDIAELQSGVGFVSLQGAYDTGAAIDVTLTRGPVELRSTLATGVGPLSVMMDGANVFVVDDVGEVNITPSSGRSFNVNTSGVSGVGIVGNNAVDLDSTIGSVTLGTAGVPRITVDNAGGVKIGAGTLVSPLHFFYDSTADNATTGFTIEQTNVSGNVMLHLVDRFARFVIGTDNSNDNELRISPGPFINSSIGMNMDFVTGNVAIGNSTAAPAAVLTLASQTKGFLPPRMTTTQKNTIGGASAGMIVYDNTTNELNVRGPSAFAGILVAGASAGGDLSGTLPSPSVATVGGTAAATIGAHPALTNNPHAVTAGQTGALPTTGGNMSGNLSMISGTQVRFAGGSGNNYLLGNVGNTGRLGIFTENVERLSVSLGGVVNATSALQVNGISVLTVAGGNLTGGLGFHGTTAPAQAADPGILTDSTTGTADGTVVDVGAAFSQATLNNNFADLIAKINALRAIVSAGAGGVGLAA